MKNRDLFKLKNNTFLNLFFALFFILNTINLKGQTSTQPSGSGTQCDPYLIGTLNNLYWITQNSSTWTTNKYFVQTANIDATSTNTWQSGAGWIPIGNISTRFNGYYNGQGYEISNLYINRSGDQTGFFGWVQGSSTSNHAIVENLTIKNPNVTANITGAEGVGVVCGRAVNINITNVHVTNASFSSSNTQCYIGLMVGRGSRVVARSSSVSGTMTHTNSTAVHAGMGGFVGYVDGNGTLFEYCSSNVSITKTNGGNRTGGFAGDVGNGTNASDISFLSCYSMGSVSSSETGGFVGNARKNLYENCYTTSSVYASATGGNGTFASFSQSGSIFRNCYGSGNLTGSTSWRGGFSGYTDGATLSNCFWNTTTSGWTGSAYGISVNGTSGTVTGITSTQMQSQTTFTNASWNFSTVWNITSGVNGGFPILRFPTITIVPFNGVLAGTVSSNQIVCYNSQPSNVTLTGSCGNIQWQSSTNNSTWNNITGATSATLTGAQVGTITQTTFVRAVLTANSNTANSSTVTLNVNNALDFDGVDDRISLGTNSILNFTSDFTIETWLYVPSSPKYNINTIFAKNVPNHGTPGYNFGFNHWNSTNLLLVLEDGSSAISSNRPVVAGAWNHVAIVVSSSGTLGTFYINGSTAGSGTVVLTNASAVSEFIGSMDGGGSYSLKGSLDELRIWNVARTHAEITANMDNSLVGNETGLVAYYDFNQGIPGGSNTGITTLLNKTANSLNGTFVNFSNTGTSSNFIDGNHLSVVSPTNIGCNGSTSPRLYYGNTGKVASSLQWYSNSSASTTGGTLISGATSTFYDVPTNISGTKHYYIVASGTCNSVTNSNFAQVVVEDPTISGNTNLYLGHTTSYTTTVTPASSSPWVSASTAFATINSSGLITPVAQGSSVITFTSNLGCTSTKTINVMPAQWTGTTNTDFNTGTNWNGQYVPTVLTNIALSSTATRDMLLDGSKTISTLTFNGANRKLVLGNHNLTLTTVSGANASNYIQTNGTGVVIRTIANATNFTFPVGNANYNPVNIANNTGTSDNFNVKVRDAVLTDGTSGTQMTDPLVNVTWDINKTNANAGSGINFTMQWESSQERNSINSYRLNHYNSSTSQWEFASRSTTSSTSGSTTKTMTHTGYTGTFSPFAVGGDFTPLPIDLVSFNATPNNNSVDLTWTTFGDNKNPFNILKSTDGVNWKSIGTQIPTENSVHYLFTDNQPAPVNYYQLSQIDNSNTMQYSDIRIVNFNSNKLVIFPNPNNGEFTIQSNHVVDFQVTDYTGKVILEGNNSNPLIKTNLTKGIYFIKITEGDKTTFSKLIVK